MKKLSDRIEDAMRRHTESYPDGDWQSVNEELGRLFYESMPILIVNGKDPWVGGNEGRVKKLRSMGF